MANLKVGTKAPAFSLPDQDGKKVSLKDFKGQRVILYFYPKDMTPGCTQQACDFRDALSQIKRKKLSSWVLAKTLQSAIVNSLKNMT